MGTKPSVILTLAGDEDQLSRAFQRTVKGASELEQSVSASSRSLADAVDQSLDRVDRSTKRSGQSFREVADAADEGMGRAGRSSREAGEQFREAGEKFSSISAGMVAKVAAVGLSFADAFSNVFAQSNVGGELAAQLGGGAERAAELGKLAGQIYAENFGDSVKDAGAALKSTLRFNLVDEDAADADVKAVTEKLITVAQVTEEETGAVARAVQQMLRVGLVQSAQQGFDLIVRAEQQGLNKSQDLLDTLNEYGTQFRKIGLDGPLALGLISQAVQAGARDSDVAADAIKEFSIRAIDGSKATGTAMETLFGAKFKGVIDDVAAGGPRAAGAFDAVLDKLRAVKDPAERAQLAVALFGTQAEDLGAALFAMDTSTAVQGLGDLAGATDEAMGALGGTAEAQFETFKRSMETKLIDVINKAAPVIQGLFTFLTDHADIFLPMAAAIGAVVVAQWAWNAAVSANPIVLLIGLLAGLVAGFMILWERSAGFRDFFIAMWGILKSTVGGVVDAIIAAWNGVIGFFGGLPRRIGEALGSLGNIIGGVFKGAVNVLIDGINWGIRRINDLIHGVNWVSKFVGIPAIPDVPQIARLHQGGIVPGFPGTDVLVMAKAGERITADGQGGGGGGGGIYVDPSSGGAVAGLFDYLVRTGAVQGVRR